MSYNKGKNNPMYGLRGKLHPRYGKHHTEEAKKSISKTLKENPPMKGKHHSKKSRKQMSNMRKELFKNGYIHPMKDQHHSKETRKDMSIAKKGKSWEEIFGIENAKNMKKIKSDFMKQQNPSEYTRKKRSDSLVKYYEEHPEEEKIRNERMKNLMSNSTYKQKSIENAEIILKKYGRWKSKLEKRISVYILNKRIHGINYQIRIDNKNDKYGRLDFIGEKIFSGKPIEFHPYDFKNHIRLHENENKAIEYFIERSSYWINQPELKNHHNKTLEELGLIIIVKVIFRKNNIHLIWYEKENNEIVKKEYTFLNANYSSNDDLYPNVTPS